MGFVEETGHCEHGRFRDLLSGERSYRAPEVWGRAEDVSGGCLEKQDYTFIRFHSKAVCGDGMAYLAIRIPGLHGQPASASLSSYLHPID